MTVDDQETVAINDQKIPIYMPILDEPSQINYYLTKP